MSCFNFFLVPSFKDIPDVQLVSAVCPAWYRVRRHLHYGSDIVIYPNFSCIQFFIFQFFSLLSDVVELQGRPNVIKGLKGCKKFNGGDTRYALVGLSMVACKYGTLMVINRTGSVMLVRQ